MSCSGGIIDENEDENNGGGCGFSTIMTGQSRNREILEIFNHDHDPIVAYEHIEEVEDKDDMAIISCRYDEHGFVSLPEAGGCVTKT